MQIERKLEEAFPAESLLNTILDYSLAYTKEEIEAVVKLAFDLIEANK